MPQFNAATVVDPLAFTLEPFVNCSGTIREPNDQQISAFLAEMKKITTEVKSHLPDVPENAGQDQLLAAMEELDPDIFMKMSTAMSVVYAALCSGKPSAEELMAVPPRIRNVFYAWLQEQVMDPEVVSTDGKAALNGQR